VVCCSSSCAALFDFPSSCGVHLIHIERFDCSIKDLGVNVADPEVMDIPVILILSYICVGIMPLYVINLDVASLFADLSVTFLAVLNDVISQFE